MSLTEWILDGRSSTVDISGYALDRFSAGRLLVGDHPYGKLWRERDRDPDRDSGSAPDLG